MKAPEYEYWQGMHKTCPLEGCEHCRLLDVEITPLILRAAQLDGMHVDAWLHMVMSEVLKREMVESLGS